MRSDIVPDLLAAIKDSIEWTPFIEIRNRYPKLFNLESPLPGHTIEFLLKITRWMALQEDVNYWGRKPTGGKYEGREKPLNALRDAFEKRLPFATIIRKHMLY